MSLRERGYEFVVVTRQDDPDLPEEDHYQGIRVYRFPGCKALAEGNVDQLMYVRFQVKSLKQTFEPDLVHINSLGPSALFYFDTAKAAHPVPSLVTLHGERHLVNQPNLLIQDILRSADWVTACSAALLEHGRQLVPEIIPHSSVIYNGLSLPSVLPSPLSFDPPVLLCVGRLVAEKGFDLALEAFTSIVDRFPVVRLAIVGDGPVRSDLEKRASELGIDGLVTFLGQVTPDNVMAILNKATIVIIPSREEAFSLVALEAALMARPVVATNVGGLPEVVVQKKTGFLVEQDDSGALAEAIEFLLKHPKTATEMGKASRRRAQEVFGWKRYEDSYDFIYRRLISGTRSDSNSLPSLSQKTV
jgi:glycogen(starch) synthase